VVGGTLVLRWLRRAPQPAVAAPLVAEEVPER